MNKIILILSVLFFYTSNSFGQSEPQKYGCKYTKSKLKLAPLTKEQVEYTKALESRSDSFDIVNYRIKLDVTNFSSKVLYGQCDIDFSSKIENIDYLTLDLLEMTIDSIKFNDSIANYSYTSPLLKINFDNILNTNDTLQVSVFYHGVSVIDPTDFGGFQFEKGYAYNLGIGLSSIPHNYGRSWFPCFDNFVERSTVDLDIITNPYHTAYCIGNLLGVDTLSDNKKLYHYTMDKQIPTYLIGVAVSDYSAINWDFEGLEKDIPIQLVCNPQDTNTMKMSFAYLPNAIETLEKWFGPYQWNRVGYVLTSHGAMEHPTNIAFPDFLGKRNDPEGAMGTMSHELAHHWWGDITTLTTAYDMWIKEGTSEYGHHLFIEHFFGEERFKKVIKSNEFDVLTTAHIDDDGYRALSGMPMNHTYGITTYNKGAAVIHNLRTYMGDSLFKVGMKSILSEYAYSHLDADQFEKQLESSTGLDLNCFFQDWIYAPGFNAFEIDSVNINPNNNGFDAVVYIEQKLYEAPHFHCDVPLEITFYDKDLNTIVRKVNISGQFSSPVVNLPFKPLFWTTNENQRLNNAYLGENIILTPKSQPVSKVAKISFKTGETDSLFIRAEHYWVEPDKNINYDFMISSTHYWNIVGDIPENNEIVASFFYNGKKESNLDYDLTGNKNENFITIVYRANSSEDWKILYNVKKSKFSPKDGNGLIKVTGIRAGQYAFANDFLVANNVVKKNYFDLFPNPANKNITISINDSFIGKTKQIDIYSSIGNNIYSQSNVFDNSIVINTNQYAPGIYFLKVTDIKNNKSTIKKFIIENRINK